MPIITSPTVPAPTEPTGLLKLLRQGSSQAVKINDKMNQPRQRAAKNEVRALLPDTMTPARQALNGVKVGYAVGARLAGAYKGAGKYVFGRAGSRKRRPLQTLPKLSAKQNDYISKAQYSMVRHGLLGNVTRSVAAFLGVVVGCMIAGRQGGVDGRNKAVKGAELLNELLRVGTNSTIQLTIQGLGAVIGALGGALYLAGRAAVVALKNIDGGLQGMASSVKSDLSTPKKVLVPTGLPKNAPAATAPQPVAPVQAQEVASVTPAPQPTAAARVQELAVPMAPESPPVAIAAADQVPALPASTSARENVDIFGPEANSSANTSYLPHFVRRFFS